MEVWKSVQNYEGIYSVSNLGRIKSHKRTVNKQGKIYTLKERILKPSVLQTGYEYVSLHKGTKPSIRTVHSIVANEFIENPFNKITINHINGIKTDNRVENLEWNTYSENNKHAYKIGLKRTSSIIATNEKSTIIFLNIHHANMMGYNQKGIKLSMKTNKPYKGYMWEYSRDKNIKDTKIIIYTDANSSKPNEPAK